MQDLLVLSGGLAFVYLFVVGEHLKSNRMQLAMRDLLIKSKKYV